MEDFLSKKIYTEHLVRKPDFSMACDHAHNYYEFYYLYSGNCVFSVNGTLYPLSAGDAFLVVPEDYHFTCYEGDVPCERTTVYFYKDMLSPSFMDVHPELAETLSKSGKIALLKDKQPLIETILKQIQLKDRESIFQTLFDP